MNMETFWHHLDDFWQHFGTQLGAKGPHSGPTWRQGAAPRRQKPTKKELKNGPKIYTKSDDEKYGKVQDIILQ